MNEGESKLLTILSNHQAQTLDFVMKVGENHNKVIADMAVLRKRIAENKLEIEHIMGTEKPTPPSKTLKNAFISAVANKDTIAIILVSAIAIFLAMLIGDLKGSHIPNNILKKIDNVSVELEGE